MEIENIIIYQNRLSIWRKAKKMHEEHLPLKQKSRSVSTFLKKTYEIVEDVENSYSIKWSQNGIGFIIVNEELFSKDILPKYFKHSNYSSFVRQLNMYNFHKIRETNCESHFHHQFFQKNNKALLTQIRRKPEKKKRKNNQHSQDQQDHSQLNSKSNNSIKNRMKQLRSSNSAFVSGQLTIQSYISTDKKTIEPTRHIFDWQRQNQYEHIPSISEHNKNYYTLYKQQRLQSKDRVSIQNILSNSSQNDDDKLSINNEIGEHFVPRYPTKEMFYPSSNNIYPFPLSFKGGNVISQFNILL